ncbi:DUF445 family protein [Desulfoscipio gibsoniae]|uniref:DUF445 family protein n=1 Tax=Desulfoscipio gibsoniae DSM 7213 TaxID=767817 RepID=R4KAD7_9FIRM|nr:DUF445 family protein [Desulfoscipio gibsoniae]AGL00148.1 hypothetical protein Desgi_0587 [Desulfoscipio gibsoniae DSM 7213]
MNWQQMALAVLAGAVIGYITNWIAIRMLFRPLTEKRLLGLRVPFTPGVIPRGKGRLANAVGEAVGGMLLTDEKVVRHLLQPEVEEQMRGYLAGGMANVRESGVSIGEALGDPGGESPVWQELTDQLAGVAVKLARSEASRRAAGHLAREAAGYLLDQTVAAAVDAAGREGILDNLEQLPGAILRQPAVQQELRRRLAVQIENFLNSPRAVGYYLPGAVREGIHQFITDQAPRIIAVVEQYVNSPGARRAMQERIEGFFESTAIKRFMNTIFQFMGGGTDMLTQRLAGEINRFFADEKNRAEIVARLHLLVDEMLEKSISEVAAGLDDAGKREKAAAIAAWAVDRLADPSITAALTGAAKEMLDKSRGRTWRELLSQANPTWPDKLPALARRLVENLWEGDVLTRGVDALVRREMAAVWQLPLSRVLDLLPENFATDAGGAATRLYRYLVQKQVPGLLRFIDIRSMVRQRVEELDELQVEEMLLGIMRRELTAITWLGGLLGAMLGVVTVTMQYMMK